MEGRRFEPATRRGAASLVATAVGLLFFSLQWGCSDDPAHEADAAPPAADVDGRRILAANAEPGEWMTHGRTYDEQRFSPLTRIDTTNVDRLGLAWSFDIPTRRGIEATPIVVDGVMYVTGSWSTVFALDAASGRKIWAFDPEVDRTKGALACCDAVNRGVAVWRGKVLVGTLDGRLVALDARTGQVVWETDTLVDPNAPQTITGAPRIARGRVIIGNGGAEFGVRGYVSAFDAETGDLVWRFFTVPGDPAAGFENDAMRIAAETWTGQWWRYGGGGTVWDSIVYDPELNLLYIGVGNGSPWNRQIRSPEGGDNLFLSSIVALRPETGEYVWHYQTTPGETWDYTATQPMILADLAIDGEPRKVLMQAPKNGFFYVVDRATGKLISAEAIVPTSWASHIDPETGRPVETEGARFLSRPAIVTPSSMGAHNWHPMAFDPRLGLVFVPVQVTAGLYQADRKFEFRPGQLNTGTDFAAASIPEDPAVQKELLATIRGELLAWDPVARRAAWRQKQTHVWNGGVLATAGGVVYQGTPDGRFVSFDSRTGAPLWEFDAQTGVMAGPISFEVAGDQFIAVAAGWGSGFALLGGPAASRIEAVNRSRVLAFKLGGEASLPAVEETTRSLSPPSRFGEETLLAAGKDAYHRFCFRCHGDGAYGGGVIPDLRFSRTLARREDWQAIVRSGVLRDRGMPSFEGVVDAATVDAIRAYVVKRANDALDLRASAGS